MTLLLLIVGCAGGGADSDAPSPEVPTYVLFAADAAGEVPLAWEAWFAALGRTEMIQADAEQDSFDRGQSLTVLLPDLSRDSKQSVEAWTAGDANVLAMGVGGARAYDGLDLGIGYSDGGEGAVDGLSVNDGYEGDAVFAGVDLTDGPIVEVWSAPVTDVGIIPGAEGLEVLAWDDRYPGDYADLCHVDRYWFWGWGSDTDGTPAEMTADGALIWSNLVSSLL